MAPPRIAIYNRPKIRAVFYQFVVLATVVWLGYEFALNAKANLDALKIASGFGFLDNTAGFAVNQSLIPYNESDTYGRVFLVGLLNTLLVAGIGIVLATILGFFIGIARLSRNWLLARLAEAYVELIRNLPLLFQLLFWYLAVLGTLPGPRQSISLFGEIFLNNRGIIVPAPVAGKGAGVVVAVFAVSVIAIVALKLWARRLQMRTGRRVPLLWTCLALLVVAVAPCADRDGISDRLREARAARLQLRRRGSAAARIRRTCRRPDDLYRRLHRRSRACRPACRAARAK